MNISKKDSERFTSRSGLYCVWVPLRDDGKAPLVSIWIDSSMTAFEPRPQQEAIAVPEANEAAMADEFDDPKRCIADAVRAIEVGS
jgi:hypothetical protein